MGVNSWLSSFLHARTPAQARLGIAVHRRDTIVYQGQLSTTHTFTIGHSRRCSVPMDAPSLGHERFPLVQFRAGQAIIQFTAAMGGAMRQGGEFHTLTSLHDSDLVERTPHGYRLTLPADASCHLCIDGWLIRLEWQAPTPTRWTPQLPLTPTGSSLAFSA